jgi:hypothetical protein
MIGDMAKTKKAVAKKKVRPKSARSPKKAGARKVTGTVLKIVKGKPSAVRLSAAEAFGDLEQACAQVLYAERHGSTEEKRVVRLAFRQYQGMRFRGK